jgi:RNA polymerase sigma-70 factor, ECF subfamily
MDDADTLTVLKAQSGDRIAMTALLRGVQAPLLRYVTRLTGDADLAADIVQDALLQIYRKLGSLNEARLFRAWSYRIASREALRRLRRERAHAHEPIDEAAHAIGAEDAPLDAALLTELPRLLGDVSPASRAVLVLHYLEDMRLRDITEVLDLSLGTVKSRLAYGLRTLRERLREPEIKREEKT